MLKTMGGIGAVVALVGFCAGVAGAVNEAVDGKKIQIKDKDPAKRQIQLQLKDVDGDLLDIPNFSEAGDPTVDGAWLHMWSSTDDYCLFFDKSFWTTNGPPVTQYKYKDLDKISAKVKEGQVKIKIKGPVPVGFDLGPGVTPEGTVKAIFQVGTGTRWGTTSCTPTKDDGLQFLAKKCDAVAFPSPEPSTCPRTKLTFTTTAGTASCGPAGLTSPPTAPTSGNLTSDTKGKVPIVDLGLGCLYFGGGNATAVPPGRIPDGAATSMTITGIALGPNAGTSNKDCSNGAGPLKHCVNGSAGTGGGNCTVDGDCTPGAQSGSCALDVNCYFGPPLPIPNPALAALTTCVLNVIQTNASGTVNTGSGTSTVGLPLSSRVYITGNTASPCPKCIAGLCDATWKTNTAQVGADSGGACTAVGSLLTTPQCRPYLPGFQAPLAVNLTPLTTGTASRTAADGLFCKMPETSTDQLNPGAFGKGAAKRIAENGSPGLSAARLGSVFCVPGTIVNPAIDGLADLPGPGAIGLNGTIAVQ